MRVFHVLLTSLVVKCFTATELIKEWFTVFETDKQYSLVGNDSFYAETVID